jgi:hypothetical protein
VVSGENQYFIGNNITTVGKRLLNNIEKGAIAGAG